MAEGRDSKEQSEFREYCRRWLAENRRGPRGSWATAGRRPLLGRVAELPTPDAVVSPIRASAARRPKLQRRRAKRSPSSPRSTAGFSEGFDTRDLQDAKALLEELR
jgi:hypothetical protein